MDLNDPPHDTTHSPGAAGNSRRKLLAGLGAGGGTAAAAGMLPRSWTKPLVDSVMLPAHAQTSTGTQPDPDPNPGPTCPDSPPAQTLTYDNGVFGLGEGNTATVYLDPEAQTISLTNAGPELTGQLAALAITDVGDEFETTGGSSFSYLSPPNRFPDSTGPGTYTVTATLRHEPTCRIYAIEVTVEISANGAVDVFDLVVQGPN